MRWRLLGPVGAIGDDGREIDAGTGKQRCVLAVLLMTPGRVVSAETLIDRVWGDTPPRSATPLAPYATRLRRVLDPLAGPGTLRWTDGGYLLDVPPEQVDLYHSRLLVHDARTAAASGDHQRAADLLNAALADWQDVTLAGVPGEWADRVRAGLARERRDAIAQLGRAGLRLGRAAEVAERLLPFAVEEPTAEGLVAVLMRALAEAGRPTEALEEYARAQSAIAEQLGATPGPELTGLHTRILRATHETHIPAQLPAASPGFTGRTGPIARLDASRLAVITGPPGVGKTALAVHWGHHARAAFPDGQLYLDLRGFDMSGTPMAVAEAARNLIVALDPGRPIPDGFDARTGLLRSLLAGRRALLVLDNARDAGHVRPLLPGTPGVTVVVTGRDRLAGLVASHGATPVPLTPLSPAHARQVLAHRLGPRLAAEPDAVSALVTAAAGIPLALVAIAARAALRPGRPLAELAAELAVSRFDGMRSPDPATDPATVISWSCRTLGPAAVRLLRHFGTPDPDGDALAELVAAGLLVEDDSGRWVVPELLTAYAQSRCLIGDVSR
ncbi:BTAD domain-containing putative transcriptional regulator [Actinoplanes sp. NPDC020271]|uniref:AfsR/SARP family transcriptional regulator n=1 Tax=Actinoplanes sp. NPDC020271 TaxID=3363896 RepID=UPI0037A5EBC8